MTFGEFVRKLSRRWVPTTALVIASALMFSMNVSLPARAANAPCVVTPVTVNGHIVYTFTTPGTCDWTVDSTLVGSADALVVGGGGGGGAGHGGGGSGGQVIQASNVSLTPSTTITITVGNGGGGGYWDCGPAGDGEASSLDSLYTAIGGGGGAGYCGLSTPSAGAYGGGAWSLDNPGEVSASGAVGIVSFHGGASAVVDADPQYLPWAGGGGGGGAGGNGSDATALDGTTNTANGDPLFVQGGDGGAGITSSISGLSVSYGAGGGGGAGTWSQPGSQPGQGGSVNAGDGGADFTMRTAGAANTGSGGGGGGGNNVQTIAYPGGSANLLNLPDPGVTAKDGAEGGSGIVVLSFLAPGPATPTISSFATDSAGESASDAITNDTTIALTGTADANVTVEVADNNVTLGTTTANGSGSWTYTTTTLLAGSHSFTARAKDANNNYSSYTAAFPLTIDTTRPTVTSFSSTTANGNYGAGQAINVTATLSENLSTASSITATLNTGGTVVLTHGSATASLSGTYTVRASDVASALTVSSYAITSAGVVTDVAGNAMNTFTVPTGANNIAGSSSIVIDTSRPTVSSFSSTTANGTYGVGGTVNITATISESITAGSTIVVTLNTGATVTLTAASNGTTLVGTYTIAAGESSTDLTVSSYTITSVTDLAGNAMTSTTVPTGTSNIAGAKAIVIDTTAPSITAFASSKANGSYNTGTTVPISATVSEAVQAGSTVTVTLDTGATVLLTAASSGTTLSGTYTIAAGENSSDLTVLSFTIGTVTDIAGNAITSTTVPTGASNIAGPKTIVVDTVAPTVTSFTSTSVNGKFKIGSSINVTATISESVGAGASLVVTLDTGATVTLTHNAAGTSLSGTYIVAIGDQSADLTVNSFTVSGASDSAGNVLATTLPAAPNNIADVKAIIVDGVVPTVSISAGSTTLSPSGTTTITITLSESSTNLAAADLAVTGGSLSGFTGSGTSYTVTFTAPAGANSSSTVKVSAASFTDPAGNTNPVASNTVTVSVGTGVNPTPTPTPSRTPTPSASPSSSKSASPSASPSSSSSKSASPSASPSASASKSATPSVSKTPTPSPSSSKGNSVIVVQSLLEECNVTKPREKCKDDVYEELEDDIDETIDVNHEDGKEYDEKSHDGDDDENDLSKVEDDQDREDAGEHEKDTVKKLKDGEDDQDETEREKAKLDTKLPSSLKLSTITVCHATKSKSNPFTVIDVAPSAIENGHGEHDDDIIPGLSGVKAKNWKSGESIYLNLCVPPALNPAPTPTPSATTSPSPSPTSSRSASPSATASATASASSTPSASATPTATQSRTASATPSSASATPSASSTPSATQSESASPSTTPSASTSPSTSATPSASASLVPSASASAQPSTTGSMLVSPTPSTSASGLPTAIATSAIPNVSASSVWTLAEVIDLVDEILNLENDLYDQIAIDIALEDDIIDATGPDEVLPSATPVPSSSVVPSDSASPIATASALVPSPSDSPTSATSQQPSVSPSDSVATSASATPSEVATASATPSAINSTTANPQPSDSASANPLPSDSTSTVNQPSTGTTDTATPAPSDTSATVSSTSSNAPAPTESASALVPQTIWVGPLTPTQLDPNMFLPLVDNQEVERQLFTDVMTKHEQLVAARQVMVDEGASQEVIDQLDVVLEQMDRDIQTLTEIQAKRVAAYLPYKKDRSPWGFLLGIIGLGLLLLAFRRRRVVVDNDLCNACGLCFAKTPDLFVADSNGKALIRSANETKILAEVVSRKLTKKASDIAEECPVDAISTPRFVKREIRRQERRLNK